MLMFKPCVFQGIKYSFVSPLSISFRHRRYTHQALNLLKHKPSLAGQDGLQQPYSLVCLLGKLQVNLPCISTDTRHQRKSQNAMVPSGSITVAVICVGTICSYIFWEVHIRLRHRACVYAEATL